MKPLSVRIAGWAFVALAGLYGYLLFRNPPLVLTPRALLGCAGLVISLCGFGGVWLAGTAAHRMKLRGGRGPSPFIGEEMELRRLAALAGPKLHLGKPFVPTLPPAEDCSVCKMPSGILYCVPAGQWFCWEHALGHAEVCDAGMLTINRAKRFLAALGAPVVRG